MDFVGAPCPKDRRLTPDELAEIRADLKAAWDRGDMDELARRFAENASKRRAPCPTRRSA